MLDHVEAARARHPSAAPLGPSGSLVGPASGVDARGRSPTGHAKRFGRFGEESAAEWYRHAGYRILDRNWRCRQAEIDLVVARESLVVFVEVKARTGDRFGSGAEAVGWRKQRRIRAAAAQWLGAVSRGFDDLRFDVVEVDRRGHLRLHHGCF